MKLRTLFAALVIFLLSAPLAHAAPGDIGGNTLSEYLNSFIGFIDRVLVPLVFAVAFVVFIWGVFQYLIAGGANEEQRDKGKQLIVWGVVGFFVMVSVWGIVNVLVGTFQFGNTNAPTLPTFNPGAAPTVPSAGGGGMFGPEE